MRNYIPPRPTGSSPDARFRQWVWDRLAVSLNFINSSTVSFSQTSKGVMAEAATSTPVSSPTNSAEIKDFILTNVFGDYLIGIAVDDDSIVRIAKPPLQRNSVTAGTIDGESWQYSYPQNVTTGTPPVAASPIAYISRTAFTTASGGYSEYQRIRPAYVATNNGGCVITAVNMNRPIVVTTAEDTSVPVGTAVTWRDLNVDGRAWAAKRDQSTP